MFFSPVFYRLYPAHLHYKFQNYYFWLFQALPATSQRIKPCYPPGTVLASENRPRWITRLIKKEGPAATPYSAATGPSKVDSFTSYTAPEACKDY